MAKWFSLHFLLVALTLGPPVSRSQPSPTPQPQPPWAVEELQEEMVNNIIMALNAAGNFERWASLLSAVANPSSLPLSATLFIPSDAALSHFPASSSSSSNSPMGFDPFIIPYHIVPQRLTFSQLQLFKTNTRLPTLLPSNSILITNNSFSNFTLDASPITHPDLYLDSAVSLHGITTVLDYSLYGDVSPLPPPVTVAEPPPPPPLHFPRSDAASTLIMSLGCALGWTLFSWLVYFRVWVC
uniref:Fasciclin n=1 Tax=Actinidia chinensis TaxID=3625 RepID=A0A5S9C2M5_ACTCH|nr:fasciclin [Actinidia chinensis]